MNNIYYKRLFFFLLLALLSSKISLGSAVAPPIGVSDGDSFDFIVDKFLNTNPNQYDTPGVYLGKDNDTSENLFAHEGDKFTITFVNATPYDVYYGIYGIDYEITINDRTSTVTANLVEFDGEGTVFVYSTDWDTLLAGLREGLPKDSIIDTDEEVGIQLSATVSDNSSDTQIEQYFEIEYRFERSTGVINYQKEKYSATSTVEGKTETELREKIIIREGYLLSNSDDTGFIPGFEITTIFTAFLLMFVSIVRRKRK